MTIGFGFESPLSNKSESTPKSAVGSTSRHHEESDLGYSRLPEPLANEIEFFFDSPAKKKSREPLRSAKHTVGNFTFRILVFPMGNQALSLSSSLSGSPKLAVYVECTDVEGKDKRWVYNSVKFSVSIVNFRNVHKSLYHEDTHSFCQSAIDRGWPDLLSLSDITVENGWVNSEGKMCIRACACSRQADTIVMLSDYNTRKETSFIGLKNHGATCYLNGLLQSYFHLGKFREIVYKMQEELVAPSSSSHPSSPTGTRMSLPLALQSVFLRLESSDSPVNCIDLIRAFGWDNMDAFTQHDVQELARILCDKLEEKLKGTEQDGSIQALFQGTLENYIECLDGINFKSTKSESFYDVPLNVRGFSNNRLESLENALRDFVAVETLEGENAYEAEGHGKTRALKGIRFLKFPPILSFVLKRFSFDYEKLDNVKLHDRFSYPTRLDLDALLGGDGSFGTYRLHTVLVHSGDVHSGHYYAFVRPSVDDAWFRFDDEQVSHCSEFAGVDDNFGGEDMIPVNYCAKLGKNFIPRPRINSAYMLVYIKECEAGRILTNPSIAEVRARVELESKKIDERKRMQEELKLSVDVKLVWQAGTEEKIGSVRRDVKIHDLAAQIGKAHDVIPQNIALFYMSGSKWHLMPVVPAVTTPRSAFGGFMRVASSNALLAEVNAGTIRDSGKILRDFVPDGSEVHVLAVAGPGYGNWVESTGLGLVAVKFFDVDKKKFMPENGWKVVSLAAPVASLIEGLSADALARVKDGSTQEEDWLGYVDDGEVRMVDLQASFALERIPIGATIILQANTICDAETEESSEDDGGAVVPSYPIRTVLDFVHANASKVDVDIFLHSIAEPLAVDGVLANGKYDESGIVDVESWGCSKTSTTMDVRWSLRTVLVQVGKLLGISDQRIEIYEQPPTVSGEGPIVASDALPAKSHKIALCKRLVAGQKWKLHVVALPAQHVSVRLFDQHLVERAHQLVPVAVHSVADLVQLFPEADASQSYRLIETKKSEIIQIHQMHDKIDLTALLSVRENVLFDYLRVEPIDPPADHPSVPCWVSHVDKQSGAKFGYPFVVQVPVESTAKHVRHCIETKLAVSEKLVSKWRLCSENGGHNGLRNVHLKDDDIVEKNYKDHILLVLEHHQHPNPKALGPAALSRSATPATHKPLTIR